MAPFRLRWHRVPQGSPFKYSRELSGFRGLLYFGADPLGSLEETNLRYGRLVRFQSAFGESLLIADPDVAEELLVGRHAQCIKEVFTRRLSLILGQGLLVSEGAYWKRQRRLAAPSFKRKEIARYARSMTQRSLELADKLQDGEPRDVHHDMLALTLNIVVDALFGASAPPAHEVGEILDVIMVEYQELDLTWRSILPEWVPLKSRRTLKRLRPRLERLLLGLIEEKRQQPEEGSDLLSRLLTATDERGERMSNKQLVDETLTVFLAGHETVALTLSYALDLLARHQPIQAKLRKELAETLKGATPGAEHYEALKLTRAVVSEAMRLYPPAWAFGREATESFALAGETIRPQTRFLVCPWLMHRDPRWFPDPLVFKPERWLDGSTEQLPRLAYLPFGAGPRICIGNHFALMEAVLVLATLLQTRSVTSTTSRAPELSPSITLRPTSKIELSFSRAAAPAQ